MLIIEKITNKGLMLLFWQINTFIFFYIIRKMITFASCNKKKTPEKNSFISNLSKKHHCKDSIPICTNIIF